VSVNGTMSRVWIDVQARRQLENSSHEHRFLETGGGLFGWQTGDDTVIVAAFGPGPRADHHLASYAPDREHLARQIAEMFEASSGRCGFLGSWHTHPRGRPEPSRRDTLTVRQIARQAEVGLPEPVLLIHATLPLLRSRVGRLAAFRWNPLIAELRPTAIVTAPVALRWASDRLRTLLGCGGTQLE
jgi:integrative and conjugative element protein (TIGR02256 family)